MRGQEFVDFEKINSLEGVFISNRYDVDHSHDFSFSENFNNKKFTELDVKQAKMDKMRRSQGQDSNLNTKQKMTK